MAYRLTLFLKKSAPITSPICLFAPPPFLVHIHTWICQNVNGLVFIRNPICFSGGDLQTPLFIICYKTCRYSASYCLVFYISNSKFEIYSNGNRVNVTCQSLSVCLSVCVCRSPAIPRQPRYLQTSNFQFRLAPTNSRGGKKKNWPLIHTTAVITVKPKNVFPL